MPRFAFRSFISNKRRLPFWQRFFKKKRPLRVRQYSAAPYLARTRPALYRPSHFSAKPAFRKIAAAVALPAIVLAWAALLLYHPYFTIKNFTYTGLTVLSKQEFSAYLENELLPERSRWLPPRNFFLVRANKIKDQLLLKFSVSSVEVTTGFPDAIRIDIGEKKTSIIYDDGLAYYLLDQDGGIVKTLGPTEIKQPATAFDATSTMPAAGAATTTSSLASHTPDWQRLHAKYGAYPILYHPHTGQGASTTPDVINRELIQSILQWDETLAKEKLARLQYATLLEAGEGGLQLHLPGWDMLVSMKIVPEIQLPHLKLLLRNERPTRHVDLRYEGRVYWK